MILPDKNIYLSNSLLGMGAGLLTKLKVPQTVSSLWEKARRSKEINSYEKYILTLDLLYMLELVHMENGLLKRSFS